MPPTAIVDISSRLNQNHLTGAHDRKTLLAAILQQRDSNQQTGGPRIDSPADQT